VVVGGAVAASLWRDRARPRPVERQDEHQPDGRRQDERVPG